MMMKENARNVIRPAKNVIAEKLIAVLNAIRDNSYMKENV
jgi:hypothetical protein